MTVRLQESVVSTDEHSVPRCAAIVSRPIQYGRGQMNQFRVMLSAVTSEFGLAKTVSEDAVSPYSKQTKSVTIGWWARAPLPEELRGSVALW
jgi:hypothetical protein